MKYKELVTKYKESILINLLLTLNMHGTSMHAMRGNRVQLLSDDKKRGGTVNRYLYRQPGMVGIAHPTHFLPCEM